MATIKSYASVEQSKVLAKILPLESADMEYLSIKETGKLVGDVPFVKDDSEVEDSAYSHTYDRIACWSLAALLGVLPLVDFTTPQLIGTPKTLYRCIYNDDLKSHAYDNPIDACVELVLKLKELNLL